MQRIVLVGLSNRGISHYALPILGLDTSGAAAAESYGDVVELVGVVEPDLARAEAFNSWLVDHGRQPLPRYASVDDALEHDPAVTGVIVASIDSTHAEHIDAALRHDLEVITEKPMVTTTADAQRIIDAERRSSGRVTVGHNFRYLPGHVQLKQMINEGKVGRVVQVLLEYHVDTVHGSSYYVRWHRHRELSGGLTLTKSTHHLDLIGWLVGDEPIWVAASGGLHFYGGQSPHRPTADQGDPMTRAEMHARDPYRQARETRSGHAATTGDVSHESVLGLPYEMYADQADVSVFDDIDALDTVTAVLTYSQGASAAYLINFSSPWEGYRIVVNGTHGQLELMSGHREAEPMPHSNVISVRPLFGPAHDVPVQAIEGEHGGADPRLRSDLFTGPSAQSLELGLVATAREGALAVIAGEALWRAVENGEVVAITLT